jgi:adenylate cyclase class IV
MSLQSLHRIRYAAFRYFHHGHAIEIEIITLRKEEDAAKAKIIKFMEQLGVSDKIISTAGLDLLLRDRSRF